MPKPKTREAGSPDRIQFSRHLSAAVANARFPGPRISGILDHRANQRVGDFSLIWHLRRHSRAAEKMYYRPYRHGSSSVLWFFSEARGKDLKKRLEDNDEDAWLKAIGVFER